MFSRANTARLLSSYADDELQGVPSVLGHHQSLPAGVRYTNRAREGVAVTRVQMGPEHQVAHACRA